MESSKIISEISPAVWSGILPGIPTEVLPDVIILMFYSCKKIEIWLTATQYINNI